jgi:predicted ArsR family transcriptional regulator
MAAGRDTGERGRRRADEAREAPAAAQALAHPSRRRIAEALAQRPEGMTAFELSDAVALHHNAVRQHLDLLARSGIVASSREGGGRRGRPSIRYRLVAPDAVAAAGHRELTRMLIRLLRRAGADEQEVERFGREEGRLLGHPGGGSETLVRAFARLGFAPEDATDLPARRRGELTLKLRHCPFRDAVSAEGGALVCALHRGLTLGLLDQAAEGATLTAFEPRDPVQAGCLVAVSGLSRT